MCCQQNAGENSTRQFDGPSSFEQFGEQQTVWILERPISQNTKYITRMSDG